MSTLVPGRGSEVKVIEALANERDLETVLESTSALVYKHSPICGVSGRARRELVRFSERHPEIPVYEIDVVGQAALSRLVAQRLGVRHRSPQIILIRRGEAVWDASHFGIRVGTLESQVLAGEAP